jgi:carbonic anhydrase/acetyltransferase-like protein (isoleucine patch superfamily)
MPVRIGNNVWIGFRCIILPGATIENRVLIGAGSVVSGVLKSDSIYAGDPAKFIRNRQKCEIVRTYLLVIQNLVVSVPNIKPKWNIIKEEIIKLFDLNNEQYIYEYDSLRNENYCYEVLLNE